jgi:hypothetical protein
MDFKYEDEVLSKKEGVNTLLLIINTSHLGPLTGVKSNHHLSPIFSLFLKAKPRYTEHIHLFFLSPILHNPLNTGHSAVSPAKTPVKSGLFTPPSSPTLSVSEKSVP